MLLAVDAGNTNIVFGIYKNQEWIAEWRYETLPIKNQMEYELFLRLQFLEANLKLEDVEAVVISSVVPQLNPILTEFSKPLIHRKPLFIEPKIFDQLPVRTLQPYQIGTDLLANAVAGFMHYKKNIIIIDFGTALTFTVVNAKGTILGVSIAPGLKTAIKALVGNTAQLPDVPLELPDSKMGENTTEAIQAGILWGYVSMIEGMLDKIEEELGYSSTVIATGGLSSILHPLHARFHKVDKNLTLEGLRLIHNLIRK